MIKLASLASALADTWNSVVLGSGQRLFDHGGHIAKLRLVGSTATTTGVILATYQPA